MYVIHLIDDPDKPGQEAGGAADAAAAAGDDQPGLQDKALAAFDEGVAEADNPNPAPAKPAEGEGEGEGDDDHGGEGGEPDDKVEPTDEEKAAAAKAEKDAADKAADDKDVKDLNLRGAAEARFRELSGKVRDLTGQLEAIGGADAVKLVAEAGGLDGLKQALVDAHDQRTWDTKLHEIGCTPQQFGQAMGFIAAINSDDPAVLKQARDNLLNEVAMLDGRLGEKTERHDPLDAHPDLKAKVENGTIDEEDAVEMARLRDQGKKAGQRDEQANQQQQLEQAQQHGMQQLQELGKALATRDGPAVFKAKMEAIKGALDAAVGSIPPAQWRKHAEALYNGVKLQAPAAAPPRVGKQPVRQSNATSGASGAPKPSTPANPFAAFDSGVEEARDAGL